MDANEKIVEGGGEFELFEGGAEKYGKQQGRRERGSIAFKANLDDNLLWLLSSS